MIRLDTQTADFEARFTALLDQTRETTESVDQVVAAIIADVRAEGDAALLRYTQRFDNLPLTADRLRITAEEVDAAVTEISGELLQALELAASRIEAFHRLQLPPDIE